MMERRFAKKEGITEGWCCLLADCWEWWWWWWWWWWLLWLVRGKEGG